MLSGMVAYCLGSEVCQCPTRTQKSSRSGIARTTFRTEHCGEQSAWLTIEPMRRKVEIRFMRGARLDPNSIASTDTQRREPPRQEGQGCAAMGGPSRTQRILCQLPTGSAGGSHHPLAHPLLDGLHVVGNLQYLPASENATKCNRLELTAAQIRRRSGKVMPYRRDSALCSGVLRLGPRPCTFDCQPLYVICPPLECDSEFVHVGIGVVGAL